MRACAAMAQALYASLVRELRRRAVLADPADHQGHEQSDRDRGRGDENEGPPGRAAVHDRVGRPRLRLRYRGGETVAIVR